MQPGNRKTPPKARDRSAAPIERATLPQSFWGVVWQIMANPKIALIVVLFIGATYVATRAAGYDVMPLLLDKLQIRTVAPTIDISGSWKYRCTTIGSNVREWGGTASIRQQTSVYGIQWKLFGQRLWEASIDRSGRRSQRELPTALPWETNWGVVTAEPAVRYGYRISTAEGAIEGYAYGDIVTANGNPSRIVGKFYQLPPFQPLHGRMEFRVMADPSDAKW